MPSYGWDDAVAAEFYEAFCEAHPRYRLANEALIAAAGLPDSSLRVLDVASGTGRTAQLAAPCLELTCVEPSAAMREFGQARVPGARWVADLAECRGSLFDRVLCGAAIWQFPALEETIETLFEMLAPGGKFVFNVPARYLGAEEPGLHEIWTHLPAPVAAPAGAPFQAGALEALDRPGLRVNRWQSRARLTLREYCDWLKIPILTNFVFPELEAASRAERLDEAFRRCSDPDAWRWEKWAGFTCERAPGFLLARDLVRIETVRELSEAALALQGEALEMDWAAQAALQTHTAFVALREDPALRSLLKLLFKGRPFRDKQGDVWRAVPPFRPELTTAAHCDEAYLGKGRDIWVAWIPLFECHAEAGPLAMLAFDEWVPQPMKPGDALLFHVTTMHKALDNVSGKVRHSVDFRYEALTQ